MLAPADDIPAFLDRTLPIWNYTMLMTYRDICPHQFQKRFLTKEIPFKKTPAMEWGSHVHTSFEHRLTRNQPLPADMNQWEPFAAAFTGKSVMCEMNIGVDRNWNVCDYYDKTGSIYGRGKADVVVISRDGTSAYIGDWKTGSVRENPFELEVQAVLLRCKYPTLQIIKGQYFWLKEHRAGQLHDLSNIPLICGEINRIYGMILNDRSIGHFEKKPTPLCGWCEVRACEHWVQKGQAV